MQNRYLDILIDSSFHKQYYLPTMEIKDYNVIINGIIFFDQPIKMIQKHMITLEIL